jgi:hypothetical protein
MAETKTKRSPAAKAKATRRGSPGAKATATRRRSPAAKTTATGRRSAAAKATATRRRSAAASRPKTAVERTAQLSDEVARSVEDGQRAAIEAVRNFVETVDRALPALPHGDGPSRRQEIVDSALEMADRLVRTQYDFLRKVVDSAGKSLTR